jgi:hypothetical protein
MTGEDGTFRGDGTIIRVEGLSKLVRQLNKAGADSSDLKDTMHAIGQAVVNSAAVPVRTGRLKATLRAGKGKTKAVVRMGGARAPYAGVIEYGWAARGISGTGAVSAARDSRKSASQQMIRNAIDDLLARNDLT